VASARWLLPALLPFGLFLLLVFLGSSRRAGAKPEPTGWVAFTFLLGAGAAAAALLGTQRAATLTSLNTSVSTAGQSGALVFMFLVAAPLHEAAKVAAVWPALMRKRVDEGYDGVVYATAAALGFAVVENAFVLRAHPTGTIWVGRTLLALPAHVFFASLWGYALGRAKSSTLRAPIFPAAFVAAIAAHGLYAHFVYGRGSGALFATLPLLAAMTMGVWLMWRDLAARAGLVLPRSLRSSRLARLAQPPSLAAVRAALQGTDEPVRLGWILFGALVNLGAMLLGLAGGVVAARLLHFDLAQVDEHEMTSAAPAGLLCFGLLVSFIVSGWLVARAASVHGLLEPALATVLALSVTVLTLGLAAPFTVVFALAVSPIAWLLSCLGAWMGREA
jgi:RsiW-degrading membrane proteinase PrsW (M82 family)